MAGWGILSAIKTGIQGYKIWQGLRDANNRLFESTYGKNALVPFNQKSGIVPVKTTQAKTVLGDYNKKNTIKTSTSTTTYNYNTVNNYNRGMSWRYNIRYRPSFYKNYRKGVRMAPRQRRRTYYRRSGFYRRGYARVAGGLAFRRMGNLKWQDFSFTTTGSGTGSLQENEWICLPLCYGITTGTFGNQRVGNKILVKKLQGSGTITLPRITDTSAGAEQNVGENAYVKVQIVLDRQANGQEDFPVTDWLVANSFYSHHNMDNPWRFKTLHEFVVALTPSSTWSRSSTDVDIASVTVPYEYNVPTNTIITYDTVDTDGEQTAMTRNQIWMNICQVGRSYATQVPIVVCETRCRYVDVQ